MGLDYRCMKHFFLLCDVYLYSLFVGFLKVGKSVPITGWCDGHWFEVSISIWRKIELPQPTLAAIETFPKTTNRFAVFSSSRRPKTHHVCPFPWVRATAVAGTVSWCRPWKRTRAAGTTRTFYLPRAQNQPNANIFHWVTKSQLEEMKQCKKIVSGHHSELAGGD